MKDYRKTNMIWYIAMVIVGVVFLVLGLVLDNQFLSGFGVAFAVVVAIRLARLLIATKDEESKEEYNVSMTDERTVYITRRARSAAFYISILIEAVAILVLFFFKHPALHVISYILCMQVLVYVVAFYVIRNKC